jgi:hypothetical protein
MPAPLLAPHVPLGFPPLAAAGGPTVHLGDMTASGTEASGQTVSPGSQTALGTEAGGQTQNPGGPTPPYKGWQSDRHPERSNRQNLRCSFIACFANFGHPHAAPTTSVTPHVAPSTPPAPRVAPVSTTVAAPPAAPELYLLHYSRHPRATQEPPAPPLHQQSPPVEAMRVAPLVNPHPMTTRAKWGF